jgi:tRNA 5-methylaminomethyl-2-thiouridine biosynthesis bifunctional protein
MYSEKFQDIYFNDDGISESMYVFIEGNHLRERFKNTDNFSICELGFGTGLNFLLTSKIFLENNQKGILYYYSIEKYPLKISEIYNALRNFGEINIELQKLIDLLKNIYYPSIGFHTIYFHPRIRLTLLLGDVIEMLNSISNETKFDAWYLDGFAPSKNLEMWQEKIYIEMARLSNFGTTFATFSCAGIVKRGLKNANFIIYKRKGFKNKKEMLIGFYQSSTSTINYTKKEEKKVAIIGGGISGVATSLSLLKRGYRVLLFDRNSSLMQGASGIPVASVIPYISSQKNELSNYTIKSYNFLISFLLSLFNEKFNKFFKKTIIQKKQDLITKMPLFIENYNIQKYCIRNYKNFFINKRSGIINTQYFLNLIREFFQRLSNFEFFPKTTIIDLIEKDNKLILQDDKNLIYEVDYVIFCNSDDLNQFKILSFIDFLLVRGQMISFSKKYVDTLKHNYIFDISLFNIDEKIYIGASFEHFSRNLNREPISDEYLLKKLEINFNPIFHKIAINQPHYDYKIPTEAFIGIRCQSKDYLPVIGRLPDWESFIQYLKSLNPNKRYYYKDIYIPENKNIFINTCHGTRGYTTAFLSGEIIASMIDQNPLPIEKELLHLLSPARFIFRKWRSSQNRKFFNL